jgi:hypothetical protein
MEGLMMDRVRTRVVAPQGGTIPAELVEAYHAPLVLYGINEGW